MKSSPDIAYNPPLTSPHASIQAVNPYEIVRFDRMAMRYDRETEIFEDVNLSLTSGSFSFLTGPSGAGKTTLLELLNLNLRPSRGFLHLFGQDCSRINPAVRQALKRRIGVVLQDFQLIDHLNVFENVALPLRVGGIARETYKQDVVELLHWVGLGRRMQALPATLSGGEKQRAAIARAVIAKPDILIADEPTGNVDADIGQRLLRLFVEMNRMGTTVLIATHDPVLVDSHAGDIYNIEAGRLVTVSRRPAGDVADDKDGGEL